VISTLCRSYKAIHRPAGARAAVVATVALVFLGVWALPAAADFSPRYVREGTLSMGLVGQAGYAISGGDIADVYDFGPGLGVRLRYRTSRDAALGLTFEAQRFNAKESPLGPDDPEWIRSVNAIFEYYQYFRVQNRAPRYLNFGVGLMQLRRRLETEEVDFPGDGAIFVVGGGTEIWWSRVLSVDVNLRYNGMLRGVEGSTQFTHAATLSLGFQFYTSR
jgi:hypothetical protein